MAFGTYPFGGLFNKERRTEMPYEVQQFTITDGWVNNWFVDGRDGVTRPRIFATMEQAQDALDLYLSHVEDEFSLPYVTRYLRDEFRIRYVPESDPR
jgi:hypothetical protein